MTTTTTTSGSPLVAYLKGKFGTLEELCKKLGLDERQMKALVRQSRPGKIALDEEIPQAPTGNAATALQLELEQLLAGHEDDLPAGFAERFLAALQKHCPLNGDEEPEGSITRGEVDPDRLRQAIQFLRGKGVGEETIRGALSTLPQNALRGGMGGRLSESEKPAGAMDSASRKFGLGRFAVCETPDRSVDRRPAMTAREQQRLDEKFPQLARIGG